MNKNLDKYTPEQMTYIMDNLEEQLNFFGYTKEPEGHPEPNPYPYFDYHGKAKPDFTAEYYAFERMNEEMEEYWIHGHAEDGVGEKAFDHVDFQINKPKEGIKLITEKEIYKYLPLLDQSTIKEGKGSD